MQIRRQLGHTYPLVINDQEIATAAEIVSRNPSQPAEVIGRVARATIADAERSVQTAQQAFAIWRETSAVQRADFLFRAAETMRARRAGTGCVGDSRIRQALA